MNQVSKKIVSKIISTKLVKSVDGALESFNDLNSKKIVKEVGIYIAKESAKEVLENEYIKPYVPTLVARAKEAVSTINEEFVRPSMSVVNTASEYIKPYVPALNEYVVRPSMSVVNTASEYIKPYV